MLEFPPDVSWPNGWTVQVDRLRHGRGRCRWADRTITVDRRLTLPQLRTTLAHEAVHARRGPCPRWLIPREELAVHAQAARALIPIGRLGEALAWSLDPRVVADELEVTPDLVDARLQGLGPDEYATLWNPTAHHRQAGA
ncbi:MAG: hypothetical protein L0K74_04550 [Acidipropionibacterium acidipropionici]|nr:hypothetical protein [Acidipropionibacterium acidipropionici]